jgi:hypothetical protein
MRTEVFDNNDWREYLTIYSRELHPENKISNTQCLVAATSGHGKTLCIERIAEMYHEAGYTILVITEKPDSPFEMCFAAFKPTYKYHQKLLEQQGITPSQKKIKIYHPMTINKELNKPLPPIQFYTIPIKSITQQELTVLLEVETRNYSVRILSNTIQKLNSKDGFLELIRQADKSLRKETEKIAKGKKIQRYDKDLKIPIVEAGSTKNISHITSNFKPFTTHYMLSNQESKHNLNWKEILRDQEHYHFFSTAFIPGNDDRISYFNTNWILNQISEHNHLKKNPLLIIVQEAKVYLPNNTKETYIQKTADNFMRKLSTMRSSGISSLADTQDYYGLAEPYRNSVDNYILGQLNPIDLERLSKALRLSPNQRERFNKLPKNTYFMKGHDKEIAILFPSHAHKEEGQDFITEYKKQYPENMRDYKELQKEIQRIKTEETNRADERIKEEKERKKQELKEKENEEKMREAKNIGDTKEIKEKTLEIKQEKKKMIYEESQLNPEQTQPKSWIQLGKKHGVSDHTAKTYAEQGQKIIEKEKKPEEEIITIYSKEKQPPNLRPPKKDTGYKNPGE